MADSTNKPDNPAPANWQQQAEALRDQKQWDGLISLSSSVIPLLKTDGEKADAHLLRGYAYNKKGEYDRAIADFSRTIELSPNNASAYNNRGNAYTSKGEHDRAIADFNRAIELEPDYATAYSNRGAAYNAKGKHDLAIADCDRAIELDPKDASAYNNRGNAYLQKGEYDLAIADYNKAIELDPNNALAYNNRGAAYAAKGDHDKAIADWGKAIKLTPQQNPGMVDNLLVGIEAATKIRQQVVGELEKAEGFERREKEHAKAQTPAGWLTAILLVILFAFYIVAFGTLAYRFGILPLCFEPLVCHKAEFPDASKILPWIPVIFLTSSPLVWAVRISNRQFVRQLVLRENAHINKLMMSLLRIKPEHSLQTELVSKVFNHHSLRGSPQLIINLENKPKADDGVVRQAVNLFRQSDNKQGGKQGD